MKKSYYGLKIRDNRIDYYEGTAFKSGLLTVRIWNIGEGINYYYMSPYEREPIWLGTDKQTVINLLENPPEYEDYALMHSRPFLTDTNHFVKIEPKDIEIIKMNFSTDIPVKIDESCFVLMHRESTKTGKFRPLGWMASCELDSHDEPIRIFGEDLESPIYTFDKEESYMLEHLRDNPEFYGLSKEELNEYELVKLYIIFGH